MAGVVRWLRGLTSLPYFRWIVSTILIALLLTLLDVSLMLQAFALAQPNWLLAACGVAVLLTAYGAVKWWLLMPRSRIGVMEFVRVNFTSSFIGVFFPGIIGIEGAKIAGVSNSSKDLAASVASVLVDRLFGLLTLASVVAIGGIVATSTVPVVVQIGCALLLAVLLIGSALCMSFRFRRLLAKLTPAMVYSKIEKLFECVDLYRERKLLLFLSLCLSFVFQLIRVIMVFLVCKSLYIEVDFAYLLIVVPIALFVQMIPISVFGVGIRESAMISLLAAVDVSTEKAFALSVLVMAVQLFSVFIGGLWLAIGKGRSNA